MSLALRSSALGWAWRLNADRADTSYGIDLIRDLKDYNVTTLVIGESVRAYQKVAHETVELESGLSQADRLILTLLPAQLLAFETSLRLGQNPDVSRNLSQVVKF